MCKQCKSQRLALVSDIWHSVASSASHIRAAWSRSLPRRLLGEEKTEHRAERAPCHFFFFLIKHILSAGQGINSAPSDCETNAMCCAH